MLVDYEYKSGNLLCSYINEYGNIKVKPYSLKKPMKFVTTHEKDHEKHSKYHTWTGKPVKEITSKYPDRYTIYNFIDSLEEEEQERLFGYNEPNIFFVDIENEILDKKPEPQNAEGAILSISIVNKDKALVMGVDPLTDEEIGWIGKEINDKYGVLVDKEYDFKYIQYNNEYELLDNFFKVFMPKMACITGWNFVHYDWVYLVNRYRNIGGDPTISSLTGKLKESWYPDDFSEMPAHKLIIDYMELYDKWDQKIKVKESSALDFVAGALLGDEFGKVSYKGDLKKLYADHKRDFMFYNVIDSILVQLIHEKAKYIDILYGISTLSKVTLQSAFSTLAVTEGILRNKLRDQKNIVLCKLDDDGSGASSNSVKGGFVLAPVKGMAQWTCCFDFASLYPTTMQEFNISADSYKGQIIPGTNMSIFNGHQVEIEKTDIVLLNGSVFKNEDGVVTQVMREIYSSRKKYKKEMMKEHESLEKMMKERDILQDELKMSA